jgi:hypothetical protein
MRCVNAHAAMCTSAWSEGVLTYSGRFYIRLMVRPRARISISPSVQPSTSSDTPTLGCRLTRTNVTDGLNPASSTRTSCVPSATSGTIRAPDQPHFRRGAPAHLEGETGPRSRLRAAWLALSPELVGCWSNVESVMIESRERQRRRRSHPSGQARRYFDHVLPSNDRAGFENRRTTCGGTWKRRRAR